MTIIGTFSHDQRHLGANITSYQNTGLTQNTTYYYRVRCKAGSTYSSYSNKANAKTATLAAPTALSATVTSASQVNLSWTDNTTYEINYYVERSPNGTSSWTVIVTLGANVTTYTNTSLTVGTAYYYRVRAYDGTNYSAYSSVVNQTIRTIAASAGANGAIFPSGTVAVANGTSKAFTMTPNTGYKIASVKVDGFAVATNSTYTFSNITANHTISATFSANTFTITASTGANGTISPIGAVAVNGGASQTFTVTSNSGYHVSNVLVDGVSVGAVSTYTFTNVIANHTIAASFAINTFTVTPSVTGGNGSINPSTQQIVSYGSNTTFTMTPNSGYYLSNLSVDGSSVATSSTYTFTNVTASHTIAATFSAITYTITASAGANGSISPTGAYSVSSGGTATFTITPVTNYHVADVVVDGASKGVISSFTFTNVIANHTITASFAPSDTTPPTGSIVINNGALYTNTTTVTLTLSATDTESGVSQMQFSNDGSTWSTPEPFATSKGWTLTTGDGTKTVYTKFKDNANNWSNAIPGNTITLDAIPPTVSINPVTTPTTTNSQTITGNMETGATMTISVNTTATVGLISYLTATIWRCDITGLANGSNIITVTATDPAANLATAVATITVSYNLAISNVGITNQTINTALSESTTIFITINGPATATLKIISEKLGPAGTPIYQVSQACPAAGAYLFTWDGNDSSGKVVPDEAYLYLLEASNGTSTTSYNPPAPTGTGTISCSQSTDFDPAKNLPMTVTYTPAKPSRVNINISWGTQNFKILDAFPATPGSHTYDWDGWNPGNTLLDKSAYSSCSVASLLPENFIITTGDTVQISALKIDPYMIHLSYGQFSRVMYTLSRSANVTVKLTSPSGTILTVVNSQPQNAGSQEITWYGTDPADTSGKKETITQEGDYMVSVLAVNPITGTSSTSKANVRIGY